MLAANKGSTSAYSQKLSILADRLHKDMDLLKTVQTNFGGTLQRELEALAKRGAEVSHRWTGIRATLGVLSLHLIDLGTR